MATAQNRPRRLLTLAVPDWIRSAAGTDLAGTAIEVQDARADELRVLANGFSDDPGVLADSDLFGEPGQDERFTTALRFWVESLASDGLQRTLAAAIAASPAEPSERTPPGAERPADV